MWPLGSCISRRRRRVDVARPRLPPRSDPEQAAGSMQASAPPTPTSTQATSALSHHHRYHRHKHQHHCSYISEDYRSITSVVIDIHMTLSSNWLILVWLQDVLISAPLWLKLCFQELKVNFVVVFKVLKAILRLLLQSSAILNAIQILPWHENQNINWTRTSPSGENEMSELLRLITSVTWLAPQGFLWENYLIGIKLVGNTGFA